MRPFDPRLLRRAAPIAGYLARAGVLAFVRTLCTLAFAWLATRLIVEAIGGATLSTLGGLLFTLATAVVIRSVVVWIAGADASRSAAAVKSELRAGYLRAVVRLGPGEPQAGNSVDIVSTAGEGLEALDAYFAKYLPQLVATAVVTPVLVIATFWRDTLSGIILVTTLPLIPLFMALVGWRTRTLQQRQWDALTRLSRNFVDVIGGLATLKIFGRQHRQARRIENVTESYRAETMQVLRVSFLSGFVLEVGASLAVAIVAVTVGLRLLAGDMQLTPGLFVLLLAPEAFLPIRAVGVQFHAAADGSAAATAVLDTIERADALPSVVPAGEVTNDGALHVEGVVLRRGERVIIDDRSFLFVPGELTVVTGESGVGKSSLFAALLGLIDFDGSATLGGDALVRAHIAWAPQQPSLVAGTVADNVALGDPSPDTRRVRQVLAVAAAEDIASDMPAAALSGGQAARVAIARALYRAEARRCPVLLLDEPSSALDEKTEGQLTEGLRGLARAGRIIAVASHRPAVIAAADSIIALGDVAHV